MKKNKYVSFLKKIVVCINVLALIFLGVGIKSAADNGLDEKISREFLKGTAYLETEEYQEQASAMMYQALQVVARVSGLEQVAAYDPNSVIDVEAYLDSPKIYSSVSEGTAMNGLYYRIGDLYNWGMQGFTIRNDILYEDYKPYYWGSLQQYANERDKPYNAVISQIQRVAEHLNEDMQAYEKYQWKYAMDQTNMRYALWNMENGKLYTNVTELYQKELSESVLEACFKSYGSYCIYNSQTERAVQVNVGEYPVSDTDALLREYGAKLDGNYQVYLGIDTDFPVEDELTTGKAAFEETQRTFHKYYRWMKVVAAVWLITSIFLVIILLGMLNSLVLLILEHTRASARIILYFAGYEAVQLALYLFIKDTSARLVALAIWNLAILSVLIVDGAQRQRILDWIRKLAENKESEDLKREKMFHGNRQMAEAVQTLGDGLREAMREQVKSERMKAELITNVSHDLKTPLTSIISYVDLMKRERIDNSKAQEYLQVLDQKSQRLKQLTEDLVEASRASSGAVQLDIQRIDMKELLMQTSGEFEERFQRRGLKLMENYPKNPLTVEADGRSLWRIIENLYRNVEKYAMPNTRVYLDVVDKGDWMEFSMKNISEQPLNISAEELLERFTRGDVSRTTEGSGLGLAIAKDLTELQKGRFGIYLDGDLFKVTVAFPKV